MEDFATYRGNPLIKKSGVQVQFTPEQIIEWTKCKKDPIYFAERYMKVVHVDKGLITIELYDYQKELIMNCVNHRNIVAEQSRQSGKTTAITVFYLWSILFNKHQTMGIFANKADVARNILARIQLAYENLPKWLQQGVVEWNKGFFLLENGSKVVASSTAGDSGRSFTYNTVLIDEAAHIENWEEFFTSVFPTISSGTTTKVILISSVNGLNHFYAITKGSREGKNDYKLISVPWQRVPGRDEKWKEHQLSGMNYNYEKFAQEFENEYLGSSGTLIAGWKLKELAPVDPVMKNAGFFQYEKPILNRKYVLIADCSRGKGLDYSAFQVIDCTQMPYNQVATFRENEISPIDYSEVIFRIAKIYNEAIVLVENNDIGGQVADIIFHEYDYENILHSENAGREGKKISFGFGSNKSEVGVTTTKKVKSVGCSILKMLVEQNQLLIHDQESIHELSTFSKKGNSYEAEEGKHDDLVVGLFLFSWLTNQSFFKDYSEINTLALLKEKSDEEVFADLVPFGFIDNGMDQHIPRVNPRELLESKWNVVDADLLDSALEHYSLDFELFDP